MSFFDGDDDDDDGGGGDDDKSHLDRNVVYQTGELQEMIEKEGLSLAELDYEDSNK